MTPRHWLTSLIVTATLAATAAAQTNNRSPYDYSPPKKSPAQSVGQVEQRDLPQRMEHSRPRLSTARNTTTGPSKTKPAAKPTGQMKPIEMTPDASSPARGQEGDLVLVADQSNFAPKKKGSDSRAKSNTPPPSAAPRHPRPEAEGSHPSAHPPRASMPQTAAGVTQVYFPSGDRSTSAVLLERLNPTEVRVGEPFSYEIKLTNLTGSNLSDVQLTEQLAPAFEMKTSTPSGGEGPTLHWNLGNFAPRETKAVTVSGSAKSTGQLNHCANVTFKTEICSAVKVVQPALALTKTLPAQVILCDPIPMKLVVQNTGTGPAKNVRVSDSLPTGLTTTDGQSQLMFNVGDLPAGQMREFNATLKAANIGSFANAATAVEDGGLTAEANAQVQVTKPELSLTKTGPETRYIGRPAKYEITVTNNGDAPANECTLTDDVPPGTNFVEATAGGSLSGNKVTWNLGSVAPGASQTVNVTFKPTVKGVVKNNVAAKAYCAEASASVTTQAIGIPAVLLEVLDVEDPIEVGANTTYEIVVTNQGSAEGTNIAVVCSLPPEEEFVSAIGPTPFTQSDKTITFAPLAKLPERTKATYRVTVKGTDIGDVRFHASMTSDQAKQPVEETESTHVYK